MNTQINVRLSQEMIEKAEKYAEEFGFSNVQEVIKNALRKELYEEYSIEDIKLIEEFEKYCDKNNLYVGEDELFEVLNN